MERASQVVHYHPYAELSSQSITTRLLLRLRGFQSSLAVINNRQPPTNHSSGGSGCATTTHTQGRILI